MPFQIDLSVEGVRETFQQLHPWEQRSLEAALIAAAVNPHALPGLPEESEHARILGYAYGRGLALVDIDIETKRITVRMIQPPR